VAEAVRAPVSIPRSVPSALAFVAGYIDGCTFLALFGLFVAQATGSFVVAGAQFVLRDDGVLTKTLAIPVFLLAGFATALIVRAHERRERPALAFCLAFEGLLIVAFMAVAMYGAPLTSPDSAPAFVASALGLAAMGVQSAMVRMLMRSYASTNVMTTNTTQLSIDVADCLLTWRAFRRSATDTNAAALAAAKMRFGNLFPILACFAFGTAAGALAYVAFGLLCLLLALVIVAILVGWALQQPGAA
jgi:uncharacterized membrane protein YoaK (UPF0700 family)